MNVFQSKNDNPQFIFLEKIKAMFIAIIEKERTTNDSKINLSKSLNWNLMDIFNEIDNSEKGYIDVKDLQKYINNHSLFFDEQIIRRFIHQFDKHQKFHLIYDDFCNAFNPYTQYSDNINLMNNDLNSQDLFLKILGDNFELIEQINEMANDIRNTSNFTIYEAFMGITKGNKYLDEEFMTHFLEHNYSGEEIKHLIYIIDLNNDSLISYEEFQDFFIPLIKHTEEKIINDNFYDEEVKQNQKDEEINLSDSNDYNYFDNNYEEKNENDIVNYEKSGKFRGNISNRGTKRNIEENTNSQFFVSNNNKKNYYNSFNQNGRDKVIPNNTIKLDQRNNNYKECIDCKDKNYNSMNNLNYNKNKFNNYNYNQEENNLKYSEEENSEKYNNKIDNSENNDNDNEKDNENNNFEIDIDNDYDEYCNFFRKTKKILNSSHKNDDYKSHNLQKTPDFKNKELSDKKNECDNEKCNFNNNQKDFKQKNANGNNVYKKIKKDNDYIINILEDNNIRENKKYNTNNNNYNIMHTEVEYLPKNKFDKILKIEKNADINLKNKNNNQKYNYDSFKKEENININNFTCGGINESDKENSSIKKINLSNNNNNNNDSYSLSNENNNKISKHINISNTHSNNSHKYNYYLEENNKILDSFSDRIYKENLNRKLKEKENNNINNTSLVNFIKYIQYIIKNEKKTIDNKDKLSLREDITLKDLFFIFDYNQKNNISKNEFKIICKKLFGLYPTSDQIILVFKRYDKNKDENLNISEFLSMIKPLKQEYASFLFNKKNNSNTKVGYQQLSTKSKKLLIEVVKNIIEDEGNYYKFKDDIINQNLFDLKELWDNLFKYLNGNKGLDKLEMKNLLKDNGISLSQYDLDILFNKIDYDNDQIISYEDLTEEFINYY